MKDARFAISLDELRSKGLYRKRGLLETPQGVKIRVDGRDCINFCSNDYLGLANHSEVVQGFLEGAKRYGVGSGSAHLICGHSQVHHQLEEELAEFTGRDRALLFSTGYMANMGVISALMGRRDCVFEDRLNHASLLDGAFLAGTKLKRFPHRDTGMLDQQLENSDCAEKMVASDGVFSMDGDLAPLPQLVKKSRDHSALLVIDDAHGFGVIGENGGGIIEHFDLGQNDVPVVVGTLGKAFGTFGAFVTGSEDLIKLLIQKARPYIYTTALPPAIAAATRVSLSILRTETWRRDKLSQLVEYFRQGARALGLNLMQSETPIQPLLIGDSAAAIQASEFLKQQGLLVAPIRLPTVPKGSARLRITLSALHENHDVDRLLEALDQCKITENCA